ncbi:MAG: hypothetical protein JW809_12510 [Pirellulales bacterium]|nr:hypothetical protein [Pirellulales bacterium]
MSKSQKKRLRRRIWRRGLEAGCVALGMATAWGGQARGEALLLAKAAPETALSDVFVYYTANNSFCGLESLGDIPAGETSLLYRSIIREKEDYARGGFVVVGLYQEGAEEGVAISFANDDVLTSHTQWADLFESSPASHYNHTEAEVIDCLHQAAAGNTDPLWDVLYYGLSFPTWSPYGHEATLVCFSDPTFGGTATVQVIPEPAAWVLVIGMAGALLWWRRDLLHIAQEA